ncbi:3-oxoacyl-[acyl-carrier protein] reductase [Anaerobacterium chartisolvens]|uniref:3-oxoacyl-[acyl-carrier protein] reductase n=1 Tax=Anaerobacterium chartisolvens TaxID=1297424 RepID=A0A369B8Y7_9FIRM|nr:3-oxoacyl-ACP reductase family protein [Anaerobacterium chartisolvens]RCX17999.1 3-oxoacyl-[acyl-carrier protein] reductase [Anaerobacterium chartisolvens]
MDFGLSNKAALITGGARGLGRAICLNLASEGSGIAINYRKDHERAWLLAEEIKEKYGVKAICVKGDVTSEEDVKRIFCEVLCQLGRIDILVNNSGICPVSMVKDMDLSEWNSVIGTNLTGTFLTSREMINMLIAQNKCGKIVNIASQSAFNGSKTGKSHYAASKGGIVSFTLSLAKEAARYGINVNAVAPGMMYTEMTAETLDKNMDKYKKEIPIGRIAELDEVARVVVFLASDVSSYITGATLDVSGGITGR